MFAAIKALKEIDAAKAPLIIHDTFGKMVHDEKEAASKIADHFHEKFSTKDITPLLMFEGSPRPLHRQITSAEVEAVVKAMKSGKAIGPDGIPVEALKAGGTAVAAFISDILNASYSLHKSVGIGDGILRALQKPGKAPGPLAHLRPIVLLTLLRKVLSLIVLQRIQARVEVYLSASQAGFRKGRSTGDIVWAYRWLAAKSVRRPLPENYPYLRPGHV